MKNFFLAIKLGILDISLSLKDAYYMIRIINRRGKITIAPGEHELGAEVKEELGDTLAVVY